MQDPKKIVTSYAFEIESSLLGKPLATPKRRLAALLIDLLLVAILTSFGWITFGVVTGAIFFVVVIRYRGRYFSKRWSRIAFAVIGASLVFMLGYGLAGDDGSSEPDSSDASVDISDVDMEAAVRGAMSSDSTDSVNTIDRFAKNSAQEIRANVGIDSAKSLNFSENAAAHLMLYAKAYQSRDSTGLDTLHEKAKIIVAGEELTELRSKAEVYEKELDKMEKENDELREAAENPGFMRSLKATADDLGLALGATGVYFIFFLVFWNGKTPGKRLLKLQVVRLNGEELTLWKSFERFGGYSAGLATGLLGFFQVYWDANRQGIHDKIAGTVVLDKRKKREDRYKPLARKHE